MSKRIILLIFLFFIFNLFSCFSCKKNNPVEPKDVSLLPTDTTSHDFVWTVDSIGDYGSGLRDVAIVSENEVWAVGQLKNGSNFYNTYKFDGFRWGFYHIPLIQINGEISYSTVYSIYTLDQRSIFVCTAGGYAYWNGEKWESKYISQIRGALQALWCNSPDNIYFVGKNGTITHYNGSRFILQNSGTDWDLNSIVGFTDSETGKPRIWVGGNAVLLYSDDGETWQKVWDYEHPILEDNFIHVRGLYIPDEYHLVVDVWNGRKSRLYVFDQKNMNRYELLAEHQGFSQDICGQGLNDIFMVGDNNVIEHYNGKTVKLYKQFIGGGWCIGCDYIDNNIFIVGETLNEYQAIIFHGEK